MSNTHHFYIVFQGIFQQIFFEKQDGGPPGLLRTRGGGEWKGGGGILNINLKNSEMVYIVDTANNYVLPKKSYTT